MNKCGLRDANWLHINITQQVKGTGPRILDSWLLSPVPILVATLLTHWLQPYLAKAGNTSEAGMTVFILPKTILHIVSAFVSFF